MLRNAVKRRSGDAPSERPLLGKSGVELERPLLAPTPGSASNGSFRPGAAGREWLLPSGPTSITLRGLLWSAMIHWPNFFCTSHPVFR
jgi:hypothetical protein